MVREYDRQLVESVEVRRNRLRESLLWGRERRVRAVSDNRRRLLAGFAVATLACAVCVGWSLLQHASAQQTASPAAVTAPR
jgi:hypothetical protein